MLGFELTTSKMEKCAMKHCSTLHPVSQWHENTVIFIWNQRRRQWRQRRRWQWRRQKKSFTQRFSSTSRFCRWPSSVEQFLAENFRRVASHLARSPSRRRTPAGSLRPWRSRWRSLDKKRHRTSITNRSIGTFVERVIVVVRKTQPPSSTALSAKVTVVNPKVPRFAPPRPRQSLLPLLHATGLELYVMWWEQQCLKNACSCCQYSKPKSREFTFDISSQYVLVRIFRFFDEGTQV